MKWHVEKVVSYGCYSGDNLDHFYNTERINISVIFTFIGSGEIFRKKLGFGGTTISFIKMQEIKAK